MKTNTTKTKTLLAALLLGSLATLNAQTNTENIVPRVGGFGMKFSMLSFDDLGIVPGNIAGGKTFLISLNATKNIRFEPEFGFSSSTYKGAQTSQDLLHKGSHLGGAIYGMFQRGNANFYIGPYFASATMKDDQEVGQNLSTPPYYSYTVKTVTDKKTVFGLIVGSEYFFNRHFSLGGEIGYLSTKYSSDATGSSDSKANYTNANLVIRGYF